MRYYVRVLRPRFEVACVDLKAGPHQSAEHIAALAVEEAVTGSADWTLRPFQDAAYTPHVELMLSEDELPPTAETREQRRRWMVSADARRFDRYLLLHAKLVSGEGRIPPQAWVPERGDRLLNSLCRDWSRALSALRNEAQAPKTVRSRQEMAPQCNVIAFPHGPGPVSRREA